VQRARIDSLFSRVHPRTPRSAHSRTHPLSLAHSPTRLLAHALANASVHALTHAHTPAYPFMHAPAHSFEALCMRTLFRLQTEIHDMHNMTHTYTHIGCLQLVGSLKLQVAFAECSLFYRALVQKRTIILRSLLIVGTSCICVRRSTTNRSHSITYMS